MSTLLALRVSLVCSCLLVAACSTPISPYSPLADEDEAQEESPSSDAGVVRDSGARDAGPAGPGRRDAGTSVTNCARIANAAFYTNLLESDCGSRTARACAAPGQSPQLAINQLLSTVTARCGVPSGVAVGVRFNPLGCPLDVGANGADLRGRVSQCLESEFATWRLACSLGCAGIGALAP